MFWRISFPCHPDVASELGSVLEDHVSSVSWFETKDPSVWIVEALTTTPPNAQEILNLLSPTCATLRIPIPALTLEPLPETDWLTAVWQSFPPRQIGRYYVYGSHTEPTPPEGSVPLQVNAATAFGSGEHETTTGCLLTLDDLAAQGRVFQKPLDMGCGSGILAIAIAKTWGVPVVAADNDPESVRVTTHNATLNGCAPLIKAYVSHGFDGEDIDLNGPYDLIVANILADPLIEMAPSLAAALTPNGVVILSGLLSRHKESVTKAYEAQDVHLITHRTLNDWETLVLKKEQS